MKLQVAFDFLDPEKALEIIKLIGNDVDIIEVGTSLVKLEGIRFVRRVKEIAPSKEIFYDLKTIDGPEREAQIVKLSHAERCSLLGFASKYSATKFINTIGADSKITVDLQSIKDMQGVARNFSALGITSFCVHRTEGDRQSIEENVKVFEAIRRSTNAEMMIAGSINFKNVRQVVETFNPDILVIGGAIAKAKDPVAALRKVKRIIR